MSLAFAVAASSPFVAPRATTRQGPWNAISLAPTGPSSALRCEVQWPVNRELSAVTGPSVEELEARWDRAQVRLEALLAAAAFDDDAAVVAAGSRARRALFRDSLATERTARKKVTYGRVQVCLARQRPLSYDVALVALEDVVAVIDETTEALAQRIGAAPSERPAPRRPSYPDGAIALTITEPTNDNATAPSRSYLAARAVPAFSA